MEKEYVKREINYFREEIILGDVYQFINNLKEFVLQKELNGWKNITIEQDYFCEGSELRLYGERLETDGELKLREKKLLEKLKREEKSLERKRKQYEKLKKEFEG